MAGFGFEHDVKSTRLMVDTSVAACELVASNLGRAVIIDLFAQNTIHKRQRIRIVGDRMPLGQSHYLIRKDTTKEMQPATLAFKECLRAQFLKQN